MELFIYLFASLFSVLNPIGTVPIFVGLTQEFSKKDRSRIALLTAFNVFLILVISYFVGQYVLAFFGITIDSLRIAGGIIIAHSGFSLLNKKFTKSRGINSYTNACWSWVYFIINCILSRPSSNIRYCFFDISYFCCGYFYFFNIKKRPLSIENFRRFWYCCYFKNCWFFNNCNWGSIYY